MKKDIKCYECGEKAKEDDIVCMKCGADIFLGGDMNDRMPIMRL